MSIDTSVIGTRVPEHTAEVERGRLRFFAKATGQHDPVYTDLEAARAAGHRDLPVPPTFLFCLNMDQPHPSSLLDRLGVDPRTILHGEQSFEYDRSAYAGDVLLFSTHISDVYSKKGGTMHFLVRTTKVSRDGEHLATLRATLVIGAREGANA